MSKLLISSATDLSEDIIYPYNLLNSVGGMTKSPGFIYISLKSPMQSSKANKIDLKFR
jgi:hypothetical protein